MKTLGIDLAAQPNHTAAVEIEWQRQRAAVRVLRLPDGSRDGAAQLAMLAAHARADEVSATGIDAPFGWPVDFVAAVSSWQAGGAWRAEHERSHRYRITDELIAARKGLPRPLSVSSDLIGVTAWRCAELLDTIGRRLDRTGRDGVYEVYPAATLACWAERHSGYKGHDGCAVREELVRGMLDAHPWIAADAEELVASDHVFDAFLCALSARAASLGASERPPVDRMRVVDTEGWIHVPTCALADLQPSVPVQRVEPGAREAA